MSVLSFPQNRKLNDCLDLSAKNSTVRGPVLFRWFSMVPYNSELLRRSLCGWESDLNNPSILHIFKYVNKSKVLYGWSKVMGTLIFRIQKFKDVLWAF